MEKIKIKSAYDGLQLGLLVCEPEREEIKGVVQIVHGMCEHKERYIPFMNFLAEQGYASIIHDHRGHGESVKNEEDLGYMYGVGAQGLITDTYQVTRYAKKRFPDSQYILLGHSMGSLVARCYLKKYDDQIDMLILSGSPSKNSAVDVGIGLANLQKIAKGANYKSKLIEAMSFAPYAKKFAKEKSKFAWVCSDKKVVEYYDASHLCGFTFSVDADLALFELMKETYSERGWQRKNPKMPILFMSGQEDPCMGNVRMFKQALDHMRIVGYVNVKGKIYPNMRHEILNEVEKEKVYQDIVKYINLKMH